MWFLMEGFSETCQEAWRSWKLSKGVVLKKSSFEGPGFLAHRIFLAIGLKIEYGNRFPTSWKKTILNPYLTGFDGQWYIYLHLDDFVW